MSCGSILQLVSMCRSLITKHDRSFPAGPFTLVYVAGANCISTCQAKGLIAIPTGTDATQGTICSNSPYMDTYYYGEFLVSVQFSAFPATIPWSRYQNNLVLVCGAGNWHLSDGKCYLQIWAPEVGPWLYDSGVTDFYCACTANLASMTWSSSSTCTAATTPQAKYPYTMCRFHAYQQPGSQWVVGWIFDNKCATHTVQYGPGGASVTGAGPIGNSDYEVQALCTASTGAQVEDETVFKKLHSLNDHFHPTFCRLHCIFLHCRQHLLRPQYWAVHCRQLPDQLVGGQGRWARVGTDCLGQVSKAGWLAAGGHCTR